MALDQLDSQALRSIAASIGPETFAIFGGLFLLYLITWAACKILIRKIGISSSSVRFLKWAFALAFIWLAGLSLDIDSQSVHVRQTMFLLKTICAWLFAKNFIDGFVAEIYIRRIRKAEVDNILLDVAKLAIALLLAVYALRTLFSINPGSILTSSAILTAIIGLSMQDTIGSLISGLLIQLEKPFEIGDWISVAGHEGRVTQISWRYTRLENLDNNFVIIPNISVSKERLLNYSQPVPQIFRRTRLGVARDVPPVKVKAALEEVAAKSAFVDKSMPYRARLHEFGESQNFYTLAYYIKRMEDNQAANDEINSSIWYQFARMGIEVADPVRVVRQAESSCQGPDEAVMQVLRDIRIFEGMDEHDLTLLVTTSTIRTYMPGAAIVERGGRDTTLFVILRGAVEIRREGAVIATLNAGSFFGEMSLLTGEPRSADVLALDHARCLVVDREGFRMILERNPKLLANVQEIFAARGGESLSHSGQDGHAAGPDDDSLFARFKRIFM